MVVLIKGAGDLASGAALRLCHAGFDVAMTEIPAPLAVRRTVSFSQAVYDGLTRVEDLSAVLVQNMDGMAAAFERKQIAVFVDPTAAIVRRLRPAVLVDAVMAKKNLGTGIGDAPAVIALGPGFTAGIDCHAVIETMRSHTLGRVLTEGSALPNTGVPGDISGRTFERLLRSPADGVFEPLAEIGEEARKGAELARVHTADGAVPLFAEIDGMVRGLLPAGIAVTKGTKAGDIDPRCERSHCFTVSDKALAVAGGVLEAALRFSPRTLP